MLYIIAVFIIDILILISIYYRFQKDHRVLREGYRQFRRIPAFKRKFLALYCYISRGMSGVYLPLLEGSYLLVGSFKIIVFFQQVVMPCPEIAVKHTPDLFVVPIRVLVTAAVYSIYPDGRLYCKIQCQRQRTVNCS
jgi:hypothetical protein